MATPVERAMLTGRDTPLPPLHLRDYYYRTWRRAAFDRACQGARAELVSRGLGPGHSVLDIGCGIGNLALGLVGYLRGPYHGVDIHREAIAWCRQEITPRHPAFQFHHADLVSGAYNAAGRASAATYTFPFPGRSFDYVFVGSVFTHLLPDAVEHYVREIARLLAPGGVCVASCFLLNAETLRGVASGKSFISFDVLHPSGVCRLHDSAMPEAAVALEETFVRRVHERAALRIQDVRRGRWSTGEQHDQDVLTVVSTTDDVRHAGEG